MVNCTFSGAGTMNDNLVPCGDINSENPVLACCASGDVCLENSICHYFHSLGGGSSYYSAGCSSGNFSDPASSNVCPNRCEDKHRPDITWVEDSKSWACCGTDDKGNIDCSNPSTEQFAAAAPSSLSVTWTAGVGAPTPTATTSSTSNPSSAANDENKPFSHAGKKAGITIGIVVGIAVFFLAMFIIFWKWRRNSPKGAKEWLPARSLPDTEQSSTAELDSTQRGELHEDTMPPRGPSELPDRFSSHVEVAHEPRHELS